jgi:hypothetical protein
MLYNCATAVEIRQVFGDWLSELASWEWFATFTFRDPCNPRFPGWTKVGWKSAHNALKKWNSAIMSECLGTLQPRWIAVMEFQQNRGVPHWHLLVANTGEERRMDWVDWWYENYGIARILPYKQELGARYYLGKYLTKEIADIQFSGGLDKAFRMRYA